MPSILGGSHGGMGPTWPCGDEKVIVSQIRANTNQRAMITERLHGP
jgi:hypothetical protein